ncbi:hypothetical protein NLG97_g8426 [Lecanicillium saksenae]|uniref:Uncharacterized protein n=1 Tax=Lecanicillium saksenae TaxID=468837 RepID=A0ACC1QK50_9HYPO|nr:hypothetical protein NLG97_g8426 [Lecanicillium saksenae]
MTCLRRAKLQAEKRDAPLQGVVIECLKTRNSKCRGCERLKSSCLLPIDHCEGARDELNGILAYVNWQIVEGLQGTSGLGECLLEEEARAIQLALAELCGQFDNVELKLRRIHGLTGKVGDTRDARRTYDGAVDRLRARLLAVNPAPPITASPEEQALWASTQVIRLPHDSHGCHADWHNAMREMGLSLVSTLGERFEGVSEMVESEWPIPIDPNVLGIITMTASIPDKMRAVVCDTPGPVSVLQIKDVPVPVPGPGQVLIKVLAFGINRAEMFTRQGHSPTVKFPRIVGIELVGRVAGYPTGDAENIPLGTLVATCMGGLGRELPGSYAEYACQSLKFVVPFPDVGLDLATMAAIPEMLQTTYGSLTEALNLQPGESLLIRGSTSSIGLAAIQLGKYLGASRIGATSRSADREALLKSTGADIVYIDDGNLASQIAAGEQFDKILELIGTKTLKDSILCLKPKGTVCMTGIQGGEWAFNDFSPITDLPQRRRLTSYGGDEFDFISMPWEELIAAVKDGKINIPIRQFKLDQIQEIHEILESGGGGNKMVVVL